MLCLNFRLHGSLTQQERSAIFKAFREAKSGVLLTTVSAILLLYTSFAIKLNKIMEFYFEQEIDVNQFQMLYFPIFYLTVFSLRSVYGLREL